MEDSNHRTGISPFYGWPSARLACGGLVATLIASTMAVGAAETADPGNAATNLPPVVKRFVEAKEKQLRRVADRVGMEVSPEAKEYFATARSGDWRQAMSMFDSVKNSVQGDDLDTKLVAAVTAGVTLEVQLAMGQYLEGDTELASKLGEAFMSSIPKDAIYFGGTDAGRGLPTLLSRSHEQGDPFLTITQNALADGRYLVYLREMYGAKGYFPSDADATEAFQQYLKDAQDRLTHDRMHPDEPKQLKPGEDVRVDGNRVNVSGQVAVMAINARLAQAIFDRNPDRSFYVEESFPLDWMYPNLAPHGLILELQRNPVSEISTNEIQKDWKYWEDQMKPLIGGWLKPRTTVEDIAAFAKRIYADHNYAGFTGNRKFTEAEEIRKVYGKLRAASAGVYAWRAQHAKLRAARERMDSAADGAFRQAWALSPESSEVVFRFVNFLLTQKRSGDALRVAEVAANLAPGNGQYDSLVQQVRRLSTPSSEPAAK